MNYLRFDKLNAKRENFVELSSYLNRITPILQELIKNPSSSESLETATDKLAHDVNATDILTTIARSPAAT